MINMPDVTFEGGYLPVNADLIDQKLNDIWREATGAPEDLPFVKLCLANVLVVSDADSRIEAEILAQQLAIRHPSRVLLIVVDEILATYSAFVRTACEFNREAGAYVCWEIVEILSDTPRSVHIGGAVRSLLVDSVPVVTVDLRAYQSTPDFDHDLHQMSDYYFVQADVVPAGAQFKGFMPLGWYRTLSLRELIGRAVGCVLQQKKSLSVSSITIFYGEERERLDPLLAGWFVGRLADQGKLTEAESGAGFLFRGSPVDLRWEKSASQDNRIVEIRMGDELTLLVSSSVSDHTGNREYKVVCDGVTMTQPAAEPDLVSYVLAAVGDDTEFKEYAAVQRISTRLPIP